MRACNQIVYIICERLLILSGQGDHQLKYGMDENQLPFASSFYCTHFDDDDKHRWTSSKTGGTLSRNDKRYDTKYN